MSAPGALAPDLLPAPWADGQRPGLLDVLAPLLPAADQAPARGRDLVVLLDGLGSELLAENLALAPVLRSLHGGARSVRTVFPATTASAITSLLTGRAPLVTGVLGYEVLDPDGPGTIQQISGRRDVDPAAWMPWPNLGELSARRVAHVGPARHAGSHLSGVAYRGWEFCGHRRDDERIEVALRALRRVGPDGLVFLHVADIDHAGHAHGTASSAWRAALEDADALLGALLRRAPRGTRVTITADHGMVDRDPATAIDLSAHPRISEAVADVAGEARALMLRLRPSAPREAIAAELRETVGKAGVVLSREELLAAGLLGPRGTEIQERVHGRLPDLTVLARGRASIDDLSRRPESVARMIGLHGSLTAREALVPVITTGT